MQWLLIGGPANGKVLNIEAVTSIRWPAEDGEDYLYNAQEYVLKDKYYQLGKCFSEGGDMISEQEIERLIIETNLECIPYI